MNLKDIWKKENNKTKEKINAHQLFWYFILFSIVGLLIETVYCYVTTGVLESRKGLIWGPFCPVYGVGATTLILSLNHYRYHGVKLFIVGAILGNVIEYLLSFMLEAIYGGRFWDYSYLFLNLNGRICILYSIFWGILSVALIKIVKPFIDFIIKKLEGKIKTIVEIAFLVFIIMNGIATVWAVTSYEQRAKVIYYQTEPIQRSAILNTIETKLFSNEKMKRTFPNLRFLDSTGNQVWIRDIL